MRVPPASFARSAFQLGKRCIVQPFDATPRQYVAAHLTPASFRSPDSTPARAPAVSAAAARGETPRQGDAASAPMRIWTTSSAVRVRTRRRVGPSIVARYRPARRVVVAGYIPFTDVP